MFWLMKWATYYLFVHSNTVLVLVCAALTWWLGSRGITPSSIWAVIRRLFRRGG